MNFIQSILSRLIPKAVEPLSTLPLAPRYGYSSENLLANEELYKNLSWIAAAVDAIINLGSTVNYTVTRGGDEVEPHPFVTLLDHPNPLQSRGEFLGSIYAFYKLAGNAYVYMPRSTETAPPAELWCVPPQMVEVISDGQSGVRGYLFTGEGGQRIPIERWQMCHMKRFNPLSSIVGLSELSSLALASGLDLASQRWNRNFFSQNNAKPQGALTFADNIREADWIALQDEARKKWGGTERGGPMMLRGVGQGSVNWLQMGISQTDMQFLEARTFTKEEIWSVLAPGFASMLAVNATEANALAGKATFIELCIYPLVTRFAEAATLSILPAYGPDEKLEPVDPRIKNTVLDMQVIDQFAKYNTLNQVREKYFAAAPLPGGDVLLSQMGSTPAAVVSAPAMPPEFNTPEGEAPNILSGVDAGIAADVTLNGAQIAAAINVMQQVNAGTLSKLAGEELLVAVGLDRVKAKQMLASVADMDIPEAPVKAELSAWKRHALKRLGQAGARQFEPRYIPAAEAQRIGAELQKATTRAEVEAAFVEPGDLARLAQAIEKAAAKL